MVDDLISLSLEGPKPPARDSLQSNLSVVAAGAPVLTVTLIALNTVIFIIIWAISAFRPLPWKMVLVMFGALFGPLVKQGAYATLLTSAFLHVGIIHLLVNMYALWVMGKALEGLLGSLRFGAVYFASAITGSLLTLVFHPKMISVGASGAIFGIGGAMLVLGMRRADLVPNNLMKMSGRGMIPFFVYNLAFGLVIPAINVVAHVGGALGGGAVAWILLPHQDTSRARKWAVAGSLSLVIVTFLAQFGWLAALGASVKRNKQLTQLRKSTARASVAGGGAVAPNRIRVDPTIFAKTGLISRPLQRYPDVAKKSGIQGVVRLGVIIGQDGTIKQVRSAAGPPQLVDAAKEGIFLWRWAPTLVDGKAVEVETEIDVNFSAMGQELGNLMQNAGLRHKQSAEFEKHQASDKKAGEQFLNNVEMEGLRDNCSHKWFADSHQECTTVK
jgi:membrane associated rhomboid family serine protease